MPPKVQEEVEPKFIFERDRMIRKFNVDNFVLRQKIQPIEVPRQAPKDPAKKLKDRLDTYHNLRKMKTDYKNYIRKYGEPPFSVNLP